MKVPIYRKQLFFLYAKVTFCVARFLSFLVLPCYGTGLCLRRSVFLPRNTIFNNFAFVFLPHLPFLGKIIGGVMVLYLPFSVVELFFCVCRQSHND